MSRILTVLFLCFGNVYAQPASYTPANLHSHNDYEKPKPFFEAFENGFGSIEVDIFLKDGELLVAHNIEDIDTSRSLKKLYLQPLADAISKNNGTLSPDGLRSLILLIDIKSPPRPALDSVVALLKRFPSLINNTKLFITISGNKPPDLQWNDFPSFIHFDGLFGVNYTVDQLKRVPLISDNFRNYTNWNGKGIIPAQEKKKIDSVLKVAHQQGKKVRFWNAPDNLNAWYQFMNMGADLINTDQPAAAAKFMRDLGLRSYRSNATPQPLYQPKYTNDGKVKPVKNIILLIGDGMGLAQIYAGYTANRGALNLFNMKHSGYSKTSSYDSYVTDSAPGSTAFSSGKKTNNRFVGVDNTGKALPLITDLLHDRKKKTAIISCGDITDATPADFYAHQSERSASIGMIKDLAKSEIDILMGAGRNDYNTALRSMLPSFNVVNNIDSVQSAFGVRWVVAEDAAGLSMLNGRKDWLSRAFDKTISLIGQHKEGFFLMAEAAQIDYGGHANNISYVVTEMLDFDRLIAKAMAFADSTGETLVIVTADHETGGLTLVDGDYKTGYVSGSFSTGDHTAVPVPVFAYGPMSHLFDGVYENTAVFEKMLKALKIK
jgi:alkaline phosphatase